MSFSGGLVKRGGGLPGSPSGYTLKDLEAALSSRRRVSEILNRRRRQTIEMVWNLQDKLGISAGSLVTPYELPRWTPWSRVRNPL